MKKRTDAINRVSTDAVNYDLLPQRVADLADVVGLKAAMIIVELRGGIRLTVPKKAGKSHWLAAYIGIEALEKLSNVYGGETIEIDRCAASIRFAFEQTVAAEFEAGASNSELALKYNYTDRGIRKLRRRVESRQPSLNLDLFDE